ncbi:ABC transporter substrate-binding protein [Streptomyces sp. NPDC020480]|uniref:ABC transporter substrate-binding protein n=1 Tax=Streptomyces sp. NPDC020480 TaxID=3365076 RepID=UPI0037AFD21C
MISSKRRLLIGALTTTSLLALSACGEGSGTSADSTGPVYFGVSAPVTGQYAEYGKFYKQGFDLALDQINADGGINGRKVKLKWEDSQSDPKQSVPIAQKFVNDQNIIAELGDFSSPASMAASPVYERNKLVQYGFTNSSPKFTLGGQYMWSPGISQATAEVQQTDELAKFGKKIAVVYQNTDWGKQVFEIFQERAKKLGLTVTYSAAYLPSTTDFRPLLIRARDSEPDLVYDIGYDNDAAAILTQAPKAGVTAKIFTEQLTATGIKLAGKDAEGALTTATWFPNSTEPRVKAFTKAFKAKYGHVPGAFEVYAYDALTQLVHAAKKGGATRQGVYQGLKNSADLPSVQYGKFRFQSDRRPADPPTPVAVIVKNGEQVPAEG